MPILWSYSTFSGPGSLTTPAIDISLSTDCGTSWSSLTDGVTWTSAIILTGYPWDSTSALTVTDCARIRIRESNDTPSSWVTSGVLFPPRIWVPPPFSTDTEIWSGVTDPSVDTWTRTVMSDETACASSTWVSSTSLGTNQTWVSGISPASVQTWSNIGV